MLSSAARKIALQTRKPALRLAPACIHCFSTNAKKIEAGIIDFEDDIRAGEIPKWMRHEEDSNISPPKSINNDEVISGGLGPRTSVLMELTDQVGALHDVLRLFWKYDINLTRIESRPVKSTGAIWGLPRFDFYVDFDGKVGDPNVDKLLKCLKPMTRRVLILDEKRVHWFPRHISELDLIANRTLDAGKDLESDHPGFNDKVYRSRRAKLTELAQKHRWDQPIPRIEYTEQETATWATVWDKMDNLWDKYACAEYKRTMGLMKQFAGYSRTNIPQQQDVSEFLRSNTNFTMRPVAGLLSSRDFLNGLAFRVFFSTQYIRHHSMPLYTPEPDICHELLGHAPMFADKDFADFSQEIGLASLGASDDDVMKLAHCYWHSVEFGLCEENGQRKAYGAGLLSSFGELEYACGTPNDGNATPEIKPWDPNVAAHQEFPITTYQPVYFKAESLQDAKVKMRRFCEDLPRPFFAEFNAQTSTVYIDRPVKRSIGIPE